MQPPALIRTPSATNAGDESGRRPVFVQRSNLVEQRGVKSGPPAVNMISRFDLSCCSHLIEQPGRLGFGRPRLPASQEPSLIESAQRAGRLAEIDLVGNYIDQFCAVNGIGAPQTG